MEEGVQLVEDGGFAGVGQTEDEDFVCFGGGEEAGPGRG